MKLGKDRQKGVAAQYSIQKSIRLVLVIMLLVLAVNLAVTIYSVQRIRKQAEGYMNDTVTLYISQIDAKLDSIWSYMRNAVVGTQNLFALESPQDSIPFYGACNDLNQRFSSFQRICGEEFHFYVYAERSDTYFACTQTRFSYSEHLGLKQKIIKVIAEDAYQYNGPNRYAVVKQGSHQYIVYIVPYYGINMICVVSADALVAPLESLVEENTELVALRDSTGRTLTGTASTEDAIRPSNLSVGGSFQNDTLSVELSLDALGGYGTILITQFIVVLLASVAVSGICVAILYINQRILSPMRGFSNSLTQIQRGEAVPALPSSRVLEIDMANQYFIQFMKEIRELKIDVYERELEKQKTQLDYMNLQIKPHFFLNCLTGLYNMSQAGMMRDQERMIIALTSYFRFLFQNRGGEVRLSQEIRHTQDFLEIERMLYGEQLVYEISVDPAMGEAIVPPLMLQTFVENSLKHNAQPGEIYISIHTQAVDGEYGRIHITDNGGGFPPAILEQLQKEQELSSPDGYHIGINNIRKRLELLYGGRAGIEFDNRQNGACISITIPLSSDRRVSN